MRQNHYLFSNYEGIDLIITANTLGEAKNILTKVTKEPGEFMYIKTTDNKVDIWNSLKY